MEYEAGGGSDLKISELTKTPNACESGVRSQSAIVKSLVRTDGRERSSIQREEESRSGRRDGSNILWSWTKK